MTTISLVFELVVAGLMIALIVYCVRLDRRLRALRQNDSAIQSLIAELRQASDRAAAAVGALKTAGLDAERSLNQAIRTAQAVEDDLLRRGRSLTVPAPVTPSETTARPAPRSAPTPPQAVAAESRSGARTAAPVAARGALAAAPLSNRSEAERDLLRAIRLARAEGQG